MFDVKWFGPSLTLGFGLALAQPGCATGHTPLPQERPPAGADVRVIVENGEAISALEPYLVPGKVTVFDFYAPWCEPCVLVDKHVYPRLTPDVALRKINVVDWDTPAAQAWLGDVPALPHYVIYDKRGKLHASISGGKLRAIDRAIWEARQ